MAELDENAWVLEPEKPNLADLHRRIVVAKHAYLDVTIKFDESSLVTYRHSHAVVVMQCIHELLRLLCPWLEQRPLAHLFAFK